MMTGLILLLPAAFIATGPNFVPGPDSIQCTGASNTQTPLRSSEHYGDFVLRFEYKLEQWSEAMVVVRAHRYGRPFLTGVPVQFAHDFHNKPSAHVTGALAGIRKPDKFLKPGFGEWRRMEIRAVGTSVRVSIDGDIVNDATVEDRHRSGEIVFLDLGHRYALRNITVEEIGPPAPHAALFDGISMKGWELRDGGQWRVESGVIHAANGHGIYYAPGEFRDFELLAVFRTHGHVNSGIFLRGAPKGHRGFEVQIYSPPEAVYPTGSIYGQTRAGIPDDHEGRWTLLRVRVVNGRVTTWVDGSLAADGAVPDGVPGKGRVGLQIHLDNASIEFRELSIREIKQ